MDKIRFRVVKSEKNIKKFCAIIRQKHLYADWGIIHTWSKYTSRIPCIVMAYLGDEPIGIAITYQFKKTYVGTYVLDKHRGNQLGSKLYKRLPKSLRDICRIRVPRFEYKKGKKWIKARDGRSAYYRAKNFYASLGKKVEWK